MTQLSVYNIYNNDHKSTIKAHFTSDAQLALLTNYTFQVGQSLINAGLIFGSVCFSDISTFNRTSLFRHKRKQ